MGSKTQGAAARATSSPLTCGRRYVLEGRPSIGGYIHNYVRKYIHTCGGGIYAIQERRRMHVRGDAHGRHGNRESGDV